MENNNWRRDPNLYNEGTIVLRALNKKMSGAVSICPLPDRLTGKLYTGQGYLTAAEKQDLPIVVTENTFISIGDGYKFDLRDEVDAIMWKWVRTHPYIEKTKELAQASPDALFYIENKEYEAEVSVRREEMLTLAKYKILHDSTSDQRRELCKLFGLHETGHLKESEIKNFLISKAESFPNKVHEYFNPSSKEDVAVNLEFEEFKLNGIIWRARSGTFKFGDKTNEKEAVNLGRNEAKVIEFLKNPDNFDTLEQMRMALEELKETTGKE